MRLKSGGSTRRMGLAVVILAGMLGTVAFGAQASPLLSGPGVLQFNNHPFTLGFQFHVEFEDVDVTALGYWDESQDGLASSHDVGLWKTDGTLLASLTVPAGSGSALQGEYRYVALATAVTLEAGQSYIIAGQTAVGEDAFRFDDPTTTSLLGPNYSAVQGQFLESPSLTFPADPFATQMWTVANLLAVPEPNTALLAALGLVGLGWQARRRL